MCDDKEKTFISELLGEMKSQFNRTEMSNNSDDASNSPPVLQEETLLQDVKNETVQEPKEDGVEDNSPEDVISPNDVKTEIAPEIKTTRAKRKVNTEKTHAVKRSSRRRSKDLNGSILQSAIARKEKSYNEYSKPQRLTRQLKPTQKILENLEFAKQEKVKIQNKSIISNGDKISDDEISLKKLKTQLRTSKRVSKKQKIGCSSEAESDLEYNKLDEVNGEVRSLRKSQRMNISQKRESEENSTDSNANQTNTSPMTSNGDLSVNSLLSSRLCLCTHSTNYYAATSQIEVTFCTAVDNIDENLLGCSRVADVENTCLLRSSQRVPYQILCEMHKNRLLRHNCCPSCGVFCTQGNFLKCEDNHLYHHKCKLLVGNLSCCPHCGISKPGQEVTIKLHCSKKPILLPVQKLH